MQHGQRKDTLMHHMQKIWIGTGTVAAAILGLSLLTTPAYADETIETIPPVATATTQSEQLTTGWVHQADGSIIYYDTDGNKLTGTQEIDGKYYVFSESGVLLTGWQTVNGNRYYYDKETGESQFGWLDWNGSRYYIQKDTGKQTGWMVLENNNISRRYFFNADGVLQTGFFRAEEDSPIYYAEADGAVLKGGIHEIDGAPYWFYEDGALHTGWQTVDGKRYFYDPETGTITFGWINWNNRNYYISEEKGKYTGLEQVDGEYYPFSEENGAIQEGMQKMPDGTTRYYYNNGAFHRGWFYQNNQTYYFDEKNGSMVTGWQSISGATYYFQEDGAAKTGWLKENGKLYYFGADAQLCTGWQTIDGKRYCFRTDGSAVIGWQKAANGFSYYFQADGSMAIGWLDIDKNRYYFQKDGIPAHGVTVIDGKSYLFADDTGILQCSKTVNGITTDSNGVITKRQLSVKYISQSGFPTGCESASAVMLLQNAGYNVSVADFVDKYLDKGGFTWKNGIQYGPDPNSKFVGDPRSSSGFGCYAPVLTKAMNKILGNGKTAKNLTGTAFTSLLTDYIDNGIPVAVWASINMVNVDNGRQWVIPETGQLFTWKRHEHCLVLVGYDAEYYYMNDPYQSKGLVAYKRSVVEARYAQMGYQAVVIL